MSRRSQGGVAAGFTIVEVLISITVATVLALSSYMFFNVSLAQYFALQENSVASSDLVVNAQRIASVVRGLTGIVAADPNDMTLYAYFSPNDTYVSQIKYYLAAGNTELLADVTPMTANPPIGTLITAQEHTYTIISDYLQVNNLSLFTYLDASNTQLTQPISDLDSIQAIKINLAVPHNNPVQGANQQLSLQVTLRNRKTNL
jgi:prepilin-type N-terminal cleavage/methylation domain-containing protein